MAIFVSEKWGFGAKMGILRLQKTAILGPKSPQMGLSPPIFPDFTPKWGRSRQKTAFLGCLGVSFLTQIAPFRLKKGKWGPKGAEPKGGGAKGGRGQKGAGPKGGRGQMGLWGWLWGGVIG